MPQQLIAALLLIAFACLLLFVSIRLQKTSYYVLAFWIRILIVLLWGIGLTLIFSEYYIPESYPARMFVFLSLSIGWVGFTATAIVKIFKLLHKGWKKVLFLVPTLFIVTIWTFVLCGLSVLNYYSTDLLHSKYVSVSNPDKTLYVFPNSGAWFAKPGFSFYYRAGKLPVMEHKEGYSTIEIKKITQKGDTVICDLRTTRTFFADHNIRLVFNLETGASTEEI